MTEFLRVQEYLFTVRFSIQGKEKAPDTGVVAGSKEEAMQKTTTTMARAYNVPTGHIDILSVSAGEPK